MIKCKAWVYASQHDMLFYEVSAKDGTNIDIAFEALTKKYIEYHRHRRVESINMASKSDTRCIIV